jgi:tRNA pseudouridine55 synthase
VTVPPEGGLLLVDKPSGCTSHDVVGRVRRILSTRRVGHAGTLDPMATGLLVVAVDRATRLLGRITLHGKSYAATIRLGAGTDTDDAEGEVTVRAPEGALAGVPDAAITAGIAALTGDLQQVPSSVSAVKIDGRRAYELVRAGETVELAARPVRVERFDVVGPIRRTDDAVDLDVVVDCSSGTYIRALARDLGAALGVGGHLTALRRTAVGPFTVAGAVDVYDGQPPPPRGTRAADPTPELVARTRGAVLPVGDAVPLLFPTRQADADAERELAYGRAIPAGGSDEVTAVLRDGRLLALVRDRGGLARPELVWSPA